MKRRSGFTFARRIRVLGTAALASAVLVGNGPVQAAPDFDPWTAEPPCGTGYVYDSLLQVCMVVGPGVVNDRMLYEFAFVIARHGRLEEAEQLLTLLQEPDNSRALNVRGYVTRKLDRPQEAIGYYLKAIEQDPLYAQARAYLGEAYIALGDMDSAKEQLREIEAICGNTCSMYVMLAEAIAAAEAGGGGA